MTTSQTLRKNRIDRAVKAISPRGEIFLRLSSEKAELLILIPI